MSLLSPHLQAFMAVVRTSTVHGAAAELGLTQTAITQRIRSLEKELGTTLFLRSRKGMTLTDQGKALLHYCKGAQELEGRVYGQIKDGGKEQEVEVTIVGPTSIMNSRIIPNCSPLYAKWPNMV